MGMSGMYGPSEERESIVTLTRRSLFFWQIVAGALVSRSCQRWSEDTARLWLRLCRAVTIHAALDAGINLLDTGDYYGAGTTRC
jgi:hypothetical protein